MPIQEETPGQTKDMIISLSWFGNILVSPPEELLEVATERNVWLSLLKLLPRNPDSDK